MWKEYQKLKLAKKIQQTYESFMKYCERFALELWY